MASNAAYRPVGIEEDMRHISPNRRRYNHVDDGSRNKNAISRNHNPHSNNDNNIDSHNNNNGLYFHSPPRENQNNRNHEDDEVDGFLGFPKKSSGRGMVGVCCFALIIVGIALFFLLGVGVGIYVQESQQPDVDLDELCGTPERPSVDYDVLGGYHETLLYYIRGEEIRKFVDKFGRDDPVSGSAIERSLEAAVLADFEKHKMDSVHVEEHEILVTYPNPDKPNRLEVLHATNGTVINSFQFVGNLAWSNPGDGRNGNGGVDGSSSSNNDTSSTSNDGDDDEEPAFQRLKARVKREGDDDDDVTQKWWKHPHVSFSPRGTIKAPLVYGHYGLESDFDILESLGVSVSGRAVLVRMGKVSVADKVMEAERRGAVAVLMYWEVADHRLEMGSSIDPQTVPYASAASYIADRPFLWTPSIPCQTISTDQASSLMALMDSDLHLDSTATDADDEDGDGDNDSDDQPSVQEMYSKKRKFKESFLVELHVNHKTRTQKIRNIVATVHGTDEIDHYTIVGAPRTSLPSSPSQDVVVSTSILTQLVRSIHYLHGLHLWRPRRGVKVVSWGGAEFSNAGALMHIMNRQHILSSRAVAYIDLSHLVTGNATIAAQASDSLLELFKEVSFDIMDPRDDEQTIQSRYVQQYKKGNHQGLYSQLDAFGTDNTLSPFLHLLGIPTVKIQFQSKVDDPNTDLSSSLSDYSYSHHYKFHMAVTRILVMGLMSLLDNPVLPINMEAMTKELEMTLWQTSAIVEECTQDEGGLDQLLTMCEHLGKTGKAFEELARNYVKHNDTKGIRMVNDIKTVVERVFTTRHHGTSHHILYPNNPDGSLQHATHLCQLSTVSKTVKPIEEFVGVLERMMKEVELMLRIGA